MKNSPAYMPFYLSCVGLLLVSLLMPGRTAAIAADVGSDVSSRLPLLMPDDFTELADVAWRVEPAAPDPANPLLEGTMPWDSGGVMSHGTVLHDPRDGRWKAWIVCTPPEERVPYGGKGELGTTNHHHRRVCYFESADGVSWLRPKLPFHSFDAHKETNILMGGPKTRGAQYASVLVDTRNAKWPYEMFVYAHIYDYAKNKQQVADKRTGLMRYRSADGKRWERVGHVSGPFTTDVCYVYREPDGSYVAYYRLCLHRDHELEAMIPSHVPPYDAGFRTIYRTTSTDGNHFSEGEVVLTRDRRDHADTQYMELVPLRVPGGMLGVVSMYHPLTQTLDLRLAVSRDGRRWWMPNRRPCLANAPLGDYGGGMIWQCKNLLVDGRRVFVYYAASEGIHRSISDTRAKRLEDVSHQEKIVAKGFAGLYPFNGALCRSSWRLDRLYALASAAGGPTLGVATTTARELSGKKLLINFTARPAKKGGPAGMDEGYLQVELLDDQDRPIPGFTRKDCRSLTGDGDSRGVCVRWNDVDRAPAAAVKARFYLKRAFLYGFAFVDDDK